MLFILAHVLPILDGTKTETRRTWSRRRAVPGHIHKAKTVLLSKKYFARLRIIDVFRQRLGDMTEANARAEGGYTLAEFKDVWIDINGSWDDDQVVFVVKFKRVGGRA